MKSFPHYSTVSFVVVIVRVGTLLTSVLVIEIGIVLWLSESTCNKLKANWPRVGGGGGCGGLGVVFLKWD